MVVRQEGHPASDRIVERFLVEAFEEEARLSPNTRGSMTTTAGSRCVTCINTPGP